MDYRKLLGLGAIFLLSINVNLPAIAQVEQTNSSNSIRQIDVTIKTQEGQTFNQLIQQAETQAVSLIEREFASNPGATEIAVTILGDRRGQQVPLLASKVTRSNWQQQPTIKPWTRYFATSAVLLGFNLPQTNPATQTQSTPRQTQSTPSPVLRTPSVPRTSPNSNNSVPPPPPSPNSANNAPASSGGASLEETDPGYR